MERMGLETCHAKRDFSLTPEPKGKVSKRGLRLFGEKLQGTFNLVRMRGGQWLLIKRRDDYAQPGRKLKLRMDVAGWNEKSKSASTGRGKRADRSG